MRSIESASLPGRWEQEGIICKSPAEETVIIPSCAGSIGGRGLKIKEGISLDPLLYNDGSFSNLNIGDNIFIYACYGSPAIIAPDIICSKNSTFPAGYNPDNSRKIGGFLVKRIRAEADIDNPAATILAGIHPMSVWDQKNRPKCDPLGMIRSRLGFWFDAWLASEDGNDWPYTGHVSQFRATPMTGIEGYSYLDYERVAARTGKRLLRVTEWIDVAYGAPQGDDGDNIAAWTKTTNTGRTTTGAVEQAVSLSGADDCVGNVWERLSGIQSAITDTTWTEHLKTGKDDGRSRGQQYGGVPKTWLAGGSWSNGVMAGSLCLYSNDSLAYVNASVGFRAACDSL